MPNYIRRRVPGGTYFFTVNLADANDCTLCVEIDLLRQCYRGIQRELPFHTRAMVVLPNHLHAIWTLPNGDHEYSERWRLFKSRFTRALREKRSWQHGKSPGQSGSVWQGRFWEHTIRDQDDYDRHLAYCWFDPVRHDLVERPQDWAFSSFFKRGSTLPSVYREQMPQMRFPVGEFGETDARGWRIPRPTKQCVA